MCVCFFYWTSKPAISVEKGVFASRIGGYFSNLVTSMDVAFSGWGLVSPWSSSWWRHQIETFSALLAICAGNSLVPGEFPAQRPVTRSFDVFFDLHLNKRLSKQSWGWWFETPPCPWWRHSNDIALCLPTYVNVVEARSLNLKYEKNVFHKMRTVEKFMYELFHEVARVVHDRTPCEKCAVLNSPQ